MVFVANSGTLDLMSNLDGGVPDGHFDVKIFSKMGRLMAQLLIDLQDSYHKWLIAESAARNATISELIADLISERSGKIVLSANERYVLRLLQNVSNTPGWMIQSRVLWTNWQVRGSLSELSTALEGLAKHGLLVANAAFTEFQLTASGYMFGREG
jgi:hypothetical protein